MKSMTPPNKILLPKITKEKDLVTEAISFLYFLCLELTQNNKKNDIEKKNCQRD
jgi:hypothetical protein